MLSMSAAALAVVQRSYTMDVRAESWLGGVLLADNIPVSTGAEELDRSLSVPERVTLTVPRLDRGTSWNPVHVDDPLSAFGQQLRISLGVDVGNGFEWLQRGWFVITNGGANGDTITVNAQGLLTLIDEAKFVSPYQPSGTFMSTVQSLVEPALTVEFDAALVDRNIPVGMAWDSDRLGALNEVLDAWPATSRVTEQGFLRIEPLNDTGMPVISLTDGAGGTVVNWEGETSRDGAFNAVIAQGEDPSGNQIQGVAYDTADDSPFAIGGPFNALPVPYTMSSPLLTTIPQCRAAAATTLARLRRTASRKIHATAVPHPGLTPGDVATVTGDGLLAAPAMIEAMSLPYTPGDMSLTLRVI